MKIGLLSNRLKSISATKREECVFSILAQSLTSVL